jgi:hypothetical protein
MSDDVDTRPRAPTDANENSTGVGLFFSDRELRDLIRPAMGLDTFKAKLKVLREDPTFPKVSDFWGGTYWPLLKEWLDKDQRRLNDAHVAAVEPADGKENFGAGPRRKTRLQARPARFAVLDGQSAHETADSLPGQVHPFTARR